MHQEQLSYQQGLQGKTTSSPGWSRPGVLKLFQLRARKINSRSRRAGPCRKNKRIKQKMVRIVIFEVFIDTDRCHTIYVEIESKCDGCSCFWSESFLYSGVKLLRVTLIQTLKCESDSRLLSFDLMFVFGTKNNPF